MKRFIFYLIAGVALSINTAAACQPAVDYYPPPEVVQTIVPSYQPQTCFDFSEAGLSASIEFTFEQTSVEKQSLFFINPPGSSCSEFNEQYRCSWLFDNLRNCLRCSNTIYGNRKHIITHYRFASFSRYT